MGVRKLSSIGLKIAKYYFVFVVNHAQENVPYPCSFSYVSCRLKLCVYPPNAKVMVKNPNLIMDAMVIFTKSYGAIWGCGMVVD